MSDASIEFGSRLRIKRLSLGLSQAALAEKAGMERAHLTRIEGGKKAPRFDTMLRLATALGVGPDFFVKPRRGRAA